MKRKIFVFVALVMAAVFVVFPVSLSAASYNYMYSIDDFNLMFSAASFYNYWDNTGNVTQTQGIYDGNKCTLGIVCKPYEGYQYIQGIYQMYVDPFVDSNRRLTFTLYWVPLVWYESFSISDVVSSWTLHSDATMELDTLEIIVGDTSVVYDCVRIDFDGVVSTPAFTLEFENPNTDSKVNVRKAIYCMVCPYVATGLSEDDQSLLQQIFFGVEDANSKLDEMQAEQSSYYDNMITPNESNQSAVESMESARQEGQAVVDEYSSLNASLEKPNVDELLPDYDRVVDGYVDTSIFDVFSTLYESGYIMFMILLVVFFGVMSYAVFGKKA